MIIYSEPFDKKILFEMQSHYFGDMVKGVVDVEQRKIALDAEMHSDLETLLLENGSKQQNLWGFNLYPEMEGNKQTRLSLYKGTIYENNVGRREEDICVIKHGLSIPRETGNYKEFVNNIKVIERDLLKTAW